MVGSDWLRFWVPGRPKCSLAQDVRLIPSGGQVEGRNPGSLRTLYPDCTAPPRPLDGAADQGGRSLCFPRSHSPVSPICSVLLYLRLLPAKDRESGIFLQVFGVLGREPAGVRLWGLGNEAHLPGCESGELIP